MDNCEAFEYRLTQKYRSGYLSVKTNVKYVAAIRTVVLNSTSLVDSLPKRGIYNAGKMLRLNSRGEKSFSRELISSQSGFRKMFSAIKTCHYFLTNLYTLYNLGWNLTSRLEGKKTIQHWSNIRSMVVKVKGSNMYILTKNLVNLILLQAVRQQFALT